MLRRMLPLVRSKTALNLSQGLPFMLASRFLRMRRVSSAASTICSSLYPSPRRLCKIDTKRNVNREKGSACLGMLLGALSNVLGISRGAGNDKVLPSTSRSLVA
jgi:hypothetical protein